MDNQYTNITDYYDLWVQSGYYDYQSKACVAQSIVGNSRQVIELGVGTGLLAEKYIAIDPDCEFTGIDFTASMLEVAKTKMGDKVELIEADVVTMNLGSQFDAAISNGGVWVMYDCGKYWEVGSLIPDTEKNLPGLTNVARHLKDDGILLLNVQTPHNDFNQQLTPEIVYSQSVELLEDTPSYYSIRKSYFFTDQGEVAAQDHHKITYFKDGAHQKMFEDAGFKFVNMSPSVGGDRFAIFKKR